MDGELRQIGVNATQVYKEASLDALIKIELLFGERVHVLSITDGWAYIRTDNAYAYEGYMHAAHLVECFDATHRVSVRFAPIFPEPNYKKVLESGPLYFNSLVTVEESATTSVGLMHRIRGAGWIFDTHLVDVTYCAPDFVEECMKFLGTSYGYEKRGQLIDCSTLVQAGCIAAGIACPYDVKSGDMEKLGESVPMTNDMSNLQRGDLVFWTEEHGSHVVIMVDAENCLHATIADPYRKAFIQPLADVAKEQARDGNGPITSVRRFPEYVVG